MARPLCGRHLLPRSLAHERAALERGEDELVVAPDEFVGLAFDLPPAGVEAEFLVVEPFLVQAFLRDFMAAANGFIFFADCVSAR